MYAPLASTQYYCTYVHCSAMAADWLHTQNCPPPARILPAVVISWDRSAANIRLSRAWVRRLGTVSRERDHGWIRYLTTVYGAAAISRMLPFDLHRLTWFYWWAP